MNYQTLCMSCMENDSGDPVCPKCGSPFDLPPRNTLQLKPRTLLRDQYLIGRALGHGGFGVTYLAWDIGLETRLAVKEYLPNGVAGRASNDTQVHAYSEQYQQEFEWGLDRFLEEARTLKKFSRYPGIVSVDTIFRDNGTAYLVMEFLDGWTLEEFLKRRGGKVTFETALRIMLPVIDALSAIHADGVLHRDISPDNIHLTRDGKVKLIDFGAARNALSQKSRNLSIILKEGYAPEEQYRATGIQGPWTDVYAAAATIYHCVTAKRPQPALDRLAEDRIPKPSEMGIDIDPQAERALMIALSLKAGGRFQSMEDFKAALSGSASITAIMKAVDPAAPLRGQLTAPPPPPPVGNSPTPYSAQLPPPPGPIRQPQSSPRWIVPIALGAIALIAIVAAIFFHRAQPGPPPSNQGGPVEVSKSDPKSEKPPLEKSTPEKSTPDNSTPDKSTPDKSQPDKSVPDRPSSGHSSDPTSGHSADPPADHPAPEKSTGSPTNPSREPAPSRTGDYDSLLANAKSALNQRQYNQGRTLLMQAINLDPNKPRAYSGLGELDLYGLGDVGGAAQNDRAAISRGGEAVFHVLHDRSGDTFAVHTAGKLYISGPGVRFVPDSGPHAFTAQKSELREVKRNRGIGVTFGRQKPADLHPFHIRLTNGQNYNFAPTSRSAEAERDLILQLIGER